MEAGKDGVEVPSKFAANIAYLINNEAGARFFFVKGAFNMTKF